MKQNSIKVAVTGGIGSGKSTVCEIIKNFGYPVYSCDKTYSELLNSDNFKCELAQCFGGLILNKDGSLNRSKLSDLVFADEEKLAQLNKITHAKIFEKMFIDAKNSALSFSFYEVPVLFECGYEKLFDKVVVVLREEEERIASVVSRDNVSREKVINRINKQYNYTNNAFTQYYVIHNDGNLDDLRAKTRQILLEITN